jgi:hypothetical protein
MPGGTLFNFQQLDVILKDEELSYVSFVWPVGAVGHLDGHVGLLRV